jgi:phosphoribosylaminoimidazole-succinocarboxamide synthase
MNVVEGSSSLSETDLPGLRLWRRGKVRDVYDLGERLLIVATDRISAFDVVLPTPIPDKGRVLTQMSLFWFRLLADVVANHLITADVAEYPEALRASRSQLEGRSMLVVKTEPLPVECVARGYLVGSGWKDYKKTGQVCGIELPAGLREAERLETPLFTPSTKAESGHDENISFDTMAQMVGRERAEELRRLTIEIYGRARAHAEERGIILADTKLEFGSQEGRVVWIDEAFTPDSSRFWPRDTWTPGATPPSFDKQFVRDYLESLQWDKRPPAPPLPPDVVARTREKYLEAYARLTGSALGPVAAPDGEAARKPR